MRSLFALLKITLFFRLMTLALAFLFFLPAWASPPEPLKNVPEDLQELIQKVRTKRAQNLDPRVFRLQDQLLQGFLDSGQSFEQSSLEEVAQKANAIEFLPDIEKMLKSKNEAQGNKFSLNGSERAELQSIIEKARNKNFLSYLDCERVNFLFLPEELRTKQSQDEILRELPFGVRVPSARPHSKTDLVFQFAHSVHELEVVEYTTFADILFSPRDFFWHDWAHGTSNWNIVSAYLKKKKPQDRLRTFLEAELIRSKFLEIKKSSGKGVSSFFNIAHEVDLLTGVSFSLQKYDELKKNSFKAIERLGSEDMDLMERLFLQFKGIDEHVAEFFFEKIQGGKNFEKIFFKMFVDRPGIMLPYFLKTNYVFKNRVVKNRVLKEAAYFLKKSSPEMAPLFKAGVENPNVQWLKKELIAEGHLNEALIQGLKVRLSEGKKCFKENMNEAFNRFLAFSTPRNIHKATMAIAGVGMAPIGVLVYDRYRQNNAAKTRQEHLDVYEKNYKTLKDQIKNQVQQRADRELQPLLKKHSLNQKYSEEICKFNAQSNVNADRYYQINKTEFYASIINSSDDSSCFLQTKTKKGKKSPWQSCQYVRIFDDGVACYEVKLLARENLTPRYPDPSQVDERFVETLESRNRELEEMIENPESAFSGWKFFPIEE